jgi:hypothetical protein
LRRRKRCLLLCISNCTCRWRSRRPRRVLLATELGNDSPSLPARGEALAWQRREALMELIEKDPAGALAQAVPFGWLRALHKDDVERTGWAMNHAQQTGSIYEVQLILRRLSGDDRSWQRMNRTFMTEVRKRFLQWRSLTPEKMMEYVKASEEVGREVIGER